jgi:hypothetical protein
MPPGVINIYLFLPPLLCQSIFRATRYLQSTKKPFASCTSTPRSACCNYLGYYSLTTDTISRILQYDYLERARPTRTSRPRESLNEQEVRDIIGYVGDSHEHWVLNYQQLYNELNLKCFPKTLEHRLKEVGYFCCIACQKPFLTQKQARARWIWGLAHMF